jgi:hypothetical protein
MPVLSIDVMDVAGGHQNGADHLMHKSRLDQNGNVIIKEQGALGAANKEVDAARNRTQAPGYCGSCYGAQKPPNGCCNTCDDVRNAYRAVGWAEDVANYDQVPDSNFIQCIGEGFALLIKQQAHEGCNLEGYVEVSKVQGNFHFAPGASFEIQGMHAHDLNDYRSHKYDWMFSHTIHHLSFGGKLAGLDNPLEGKAKTAKGSKNFFSYIRV